MALRGIKVLEFAGLAPAPFCGMLLSDFGAEVIQVDKMNAAAMGVFSRGKKSISINLKNSEGLNVARKLCQKTDVLIEPYRKGVMERLKLGPNDLMGENPGLIYARLTGFGQNGPWSARAGHDINYIALSGVLSMLGRSYDRPYPPVNMLADFAGGGLICALGIVMALFERSHSGKGQTVDANMVEGSAYVSSFFWNSRKVPTLWGKERGKNLLDGGAAFYDTYETADGKFMSVGALEPQFYIELLKGLGLNPEENPQTGDPEEMRKKFQEIFKTKTKNQWTEIFEHLDACVAPVLELEEAPQFQHNANNHSFMKSSDGQSEPRPAPRLSRTPAINRIHPSPLVGQHTKEILREFDYTDSETDSLCAMGAVEHNNSKL